MGNGSSLAVVRDTGEIVAAEDRRDWSAVEAEIRKTYAPGVTDEQWRIFVEESHDLGLSPVRREYIPFMTKAWDPATRQEVVKYSGYATVHGIRALAQRSSLFDGTEGPFWCGPDGRWLEVWLADEAPAAAKFLVYRKDNRSPAVGVVTMKRAATFFDKKDNVRKPTKMWAEQPDMMLAIRAETDAYKRSGLLADHSLAVVRGVAHETEAGFEVEAGDDDRKAGSRSVHAAGAGRGLGHDEVRAAVREIRPDVDSMADPTLTAADQYAAADLIEVLDADGVAVVTGSEPARVAGGRVDPLPTPDEVPANPTEDGTMTIRQRGYIEAAVAGGLTADDLTGAHKRSLAQYGALSYALADKLIKEIARVTATLASQAASGPVDRATAEEVADWTAFWVASREIGMATAGDYVRDFGSFTPELAEAVDLLEKARERRRGEG